MTHDHDPFSEFSTPITPSVKICSVGYEEGDA